jgi:hypothetical protein
MTVSFVIASNATGRKWNARVLPEHLVCADPVRELLD